jgi:hypothetical protein
VIRRGFWVVTGAVLGVTGYRRVTRLARMLTAPSATRSLTGTGSAARPQMLTAPGRGTARSQGSGRPAMSNTARVVAAAGFVRDVRDGMAEYRDLHRDEPSSARLGRKLGNRSLEGRTLEARTHEAGNPEARIPEARIPEARIPEARIPEARIPEARGNRTSSGVRQQGRREP